MRKSLMESQRLLYGIKRGDTRQNDALIGIEYHNKTSQILADKENELE
jgi:hypothetical protein